MSHTEKIRVNLESRSYEIAIESGLIESLAEYSDYFNFHQAVIITDENVAPLYLSTAEQQLGSLISRVDSIAIPAGEASKSVKLVEEIWNQLLQLNVDRQTAIVTLGGGVVGDLAGFAAATFARGLPFIQIPTTLLAQVDSSVGGKTGINLADAKNMVGAFWQPKFVVIDPNTLHTLDEANFTSGLGEVVKYGVIMDHSFFSNLESNIEEICKRDSAVLTRIIADCCRLKAQVVAEDELETSGRRAILNYGHTFGHAIEKVFGYGTYLHGHAVSIGMQCAAWLANHLGMFDAESQARQTVLLEQLGCPTKLRETDLDQLVAAMHRDKKVERGTLRLILPTEIGRVELMDAPEDSLLRRAFEANSE